MLLDDVHPVTRSHLLVARCDAMSGRCDKAVASLKALIETSTDDLGPQRCVAAGVLLAEIHLLNEDPTTAHEVWKTAVAPQLDSLPLQDHLLLESNAQEVRMEAREEGAGYNFYTNWDKRSYHGIQASDYLRIYSAVEDVENGKLRDAIEDLYLELERTWKTCCWRSIRLVSRRLCKAWTVVGDFEKAMHFLLLGGYKADADRFSKELRSRGARNVEGIVRYVLGNAFLRRHLDLACQVLASISDLIPDEQVDVVASSLFCRVRACRGTSVMQSHFQTHVWSGIAAISHRINRVLASDIAEHVLEQQDMANRAKRGPLLDVLDAVLPKVKEKVKRAIVDRIAPLLLESQDVDGLVRLVRLLVEVADSSDVATRDKAVKALFIKGRPSSFALLKEASHLSDEVVSGIDWSKNGSRFARNWRKQVQSVKDEKPDVPEGVIMTFNAGRKDGVELIVYQLTTDALEALAVNASRLTPRVRSEIVSALTDSVFTPMNIMPNRTASCTLLAQFAPSISRSDAKATFKKLLPIALGRVTPENFQIGEEKQVWLSRFHVYEGLEGELRGTALLAVCALAKRASLGGNRDVDAALERALTSDDAVVRKWGCIASTHRGVLNAEQVGMLILVTRDSDASVAPWALQATHQVIETGLLPSQWRMLAQSCRLAANNHDVNMRRAAASVACHAVEKCKDPEAVKRFAILKRGYAADVSWIVRNAVRQSSDRATRQRPKSRSSRKKR